MPSSFHGLPTSEEHDCEPQRLIWSRLFFAFLIPELIAKLAMVIADASDKADAERLSVLFPRAGLFFWGGELLSALALSLLFLATIVGARRFCGTRGARKILAAVLGLHAIFCGLSFAYYLEEADMVNCQLFALVEAQGNSSAVLYSVVDRFGAPEVVVTLSCLVGTYLGFTQLGPRLWRATRRRVYAVMGLFVVEASLFVLLVPALVRGDLPLRFKSHGLERAPLLELSSSCAQQSLDLDTMSAHPHEHARQAGWTVPLAESEALQAWPVERRRTDVVVLVLESVASPVVFDGTHSMPFVESVLERPSAVHLDEHYASYALTTKSLFSILAGQYPDPAYASWVGRRPGLPLETLPERLQDEGYETWLLSSQDLAWDRQIPFYRRHGFDHIADEDELIQADTWTSGWGIDDMRTVERGLEILDEAHGPTFLVMQTQAAHHPYVTPGNEDLEGKAPRYHAALRYLDQRVEQLVEGLERRGRLDDTLLVVVSDHGVGWAQAKGRNVYEVNLRSLAFMLVPQRLDTEALTMGTPTSHVDLPTTVLGLLGISAPGVMVGKDLSGGGPERIRLFAGRPPRSQRGLRDGRWKFIVEGDQSFLFDLSVDPLEEHDLAQQQPARVRRYQHLLDDWASHQPWRFANATAVTRELACDAGK